MKDSQRPKKSLIIIDREYLEAVFPEEIRAELAGSVEFVAPPQTAAALARNPEILREVEIILSGWGVPAMDESFLCRAPRLEAVFHAAGSIRCLTSAAFWERGIRVSSAYAANSLPVAEYTLGAILLSLKHFWRYAHLSRRGTVDEPHFSRNTPGNYGSTVGLISFGMIARKTRDLLRPFDLRCLTYCPFLPPSDAEREGVEPCSLEALFKESDVISLHTPAFPETVGMIRGSHFASMREGATFINTARGEVVNEAEMIEVLKARPDLTAILDVTFPEPAATDSPLRTLPNVLLTPHIAGSMGRECARMGRFAAEEISRFLVGSPLLGEITYEQSLRLA